MKNNRFYSIFILILVCCLSTSFNLKAATETVETNLNPDLKSSATASEAWLKLVDQEEYDQSWDKGSATLQLLVPKKDWRKLMEAIRKPLGTVKSRQIIEQRPAKDPAGLPKGDYMVLLYNASFSAKPTAHELVTMVKESDGNWKVLTYQVK